MAKLGKLFLYCNYGERDGKAELPSQISPEVLPGNEHPYKDTEVPVR